MKPVRYLVLICLFGVSCNAPKAYIDYDEQADFAHFRSFGLLPEFQSGLSELDEERLIRSLEAGFREEGFTQAAEPDLLVTVYSEEYQEESRNTLGIGVGGTGRNVGVGISGGIPLGGPDTYLSLTFDVIDATTNQLVWQAVVQSRFDRNAAPEERQLVFDKMVAKALEKYPPK